MVYKSFMTQLDGSFGNAVTAIVKRGRSFVILDSLVAFEHGYTAWDDWLRVLREVTGANQSGRCLLCQHPLNSPGARVELHHALISKQDVKGLPDALRNAILHHTFNVVLVHADCHSRATRDQCATVLATVYGYHTVREWYDKAIDCFSTRMRAFPVGEKYV